MDRKQKRLTRCRTGCMRCRARRRKCDEGKPRCRNCIDRNFQCQYGPQLTFLTKNAHTVRASEVGTSSNYEAIRFINEEPQNGMIDDGPAEMSHDESHDAGTETSQTTDMPFWEANEEQLTLSDKDEFAVAGLLALGTKEPDLRKLTFPIVKTPALPTLPPSFPPHVQDENTTSAEIQTLLRHYRYEIASWLDICDLGQSFGINGLQLAMTSPSVWNSILSLSEISFNQLHPQRHQGTFPRYDPDLQVDITHVALVTAMDQVKECISDISAAWASEATSNQELLSALSSHAVGRDLNSAIYWLFLRLELGNALAGDNDTSVPLPPAFPYLTELDLVADPFEMVFYYAYRPLWLCTRAVHFMHSEDLSPDRPPLHVWMELVEELEHWYRERPQKFQPMLELEVDDQLAGPEQCFPVVLFANGAGLFGNQLYHTAMLILLHGRPRTARIADFHSAAMSPLWHAQRICSIALHNDRRECWDPCLLASFFMAARRMTHESQQQEVVRAFESIRIVTGWDTSGCLRSLRDEWCLLEDP